MNQIAQVNGKRVLSDVAIFHLDGQLGAMRAEPVAFDGAGDTGAWNDGAAVLPFAAAPRGAPTVASTTGIALADWDDLFRAVTARLRLRVAGPRDATSATHVVLSTGSRTAVLECVEALEQLRLTVSPVLDRLRELERTALGLQAALEHTRNELASTKDRERRARHAAVHDSLTSLTNRRHFRARLSQALARPASSQAAFGLLCLDLDSFKPVNDRYGHLVGDALLRIVGRRLARCVRSGDVVSRLGGDEFACLASGLSDREHLSHLACKLFDAVSQPISIDGTELVIRPSIGIAICPDDGATASSLLTHADSAMYRAKRERCGYAFFDEPVQACVAESTLICMNKDQVNGALKNQAKAKVRKGIGDLKEAAGDVKKAARNQQGG